MSKVLISLVLISFFAHFSFELSRSEIDKKLLLSLKQLTNQQRNTPSYNNYISDIIITPAIFHKTCNHPNCIEYDPQLSKAKNIRSFLKKTSISSDLNK